MDLRCLELTVLSAEDLTDENAVTKMDLYAVVSLSTDPKTQLCTVVDHDCGGNANWNHHMSLHVPEGEEGVVFLQVLIRAENTLDADRDVGEVGISVKELEAGSSPGSEPKVAAYQVRSSSGKEKGVLILSYKFGDPVPAPAETAPSPVLAAEYPPPAGLPPPDPSKSGEVMAAGTSTDYLAPPPQANYGHGPPTPPGGHPLLGRGVYGGIAGLSIDDAIDDAAAYDAAYDDDADDFDHEIFCYCRY